MPDFICVQCFACDTFQTYAVNTQAKDVRSVVVELNAKRGEAEQHFVPKPRANCQPGIVQPADQSQWSGFISETDASVQALSDLDAEPDEFVTSLPGAGQRKRRQLSQSTSDGDKRKMTVRTGRTATTVSGMQSHPMVQSTPRSIGQTGSHTLHSSPPQRSNYGPVPKTQPKTVKIVLGALSCSYSHQSSRVNQSSRVQTVSDDFGTKDDKGHHHKRIDVAQKQRDSSPWSSFLQEQNPEQMHIGESAVDDDSDQLLVTSFD